MTSGLLELKTSQTICRLLAGLCTILFEMFLLRDQANRDWGRTGRRNLFCCPNVGIAARRAERCAIAYLLTAFDAFYKSQDFPLF